MDRYVVFSHGKDAGPWGVKITALAGNARSEGYEVESVDYRGIDDPRERVNKLVEYCKELKGDLVLCGSSLGGYVSVAAASLLHARGVFLMAPALTMPGLPPLREKLLDCPTMIVHGWKDDIVPVEQSMEFARRHGCALHILNSDHRSAGRSPIPQIPVRILPDLARPSPRRVMSGAGRECREKRRTCRSRDHRERFSRHSLPGTNSLRLVPLADRALGDAVDQGWREQLEPAP